MKKNLYNAMVLFLVVTTITGLLSCAHSDNGQEMISMVVDYSDSSAQQTEIIKADNSRPLVQTGRSMLKDGKLSNLLRPAAMNGRENCVGIDQPCGVLDNCCGDLHCDGVFNGRCKAPDYCIPLGQSCGATRVPCCDPGLCSGMFSGECRDMFHCLPDGAACHGSKYKCCHGFCAPDPGSSTAHCV